MSIDFIFWENSRNLLTLLPGHFYASLEFFSVNLSHSRKWLLNIHTRVFFPFLYLTEIRICLNIHTRYLFLFSDHHAVVTHHLSIQV